MKISICIPVFNNLKFTKQVLKSIRNNIFLDDYEILILNNGSTDGTKEYLQELENEKLFVINLEKNIYVNPAWDMLASEAEGEYLIFLNNDITLFDKFDIKLIASHEDGKIVCPYTKQYGDDYPPFYQKYNINGTCFLLKREEFERIPYELRCWFGDDYLFRTLGVKWIQEHVIHWGSQTINMLPELKEIIDEDRKIWIEICKYKKWEDKRFPETFINND